MVVNFETTRARRTPAKVLRNLIKRDKDIPRTNQKVTSPRVFCLEFSLLTPHFVSLRTMAAAGLEEVNSVSDLERKLAEIHIPWDEIAPAHIHEWLNVYSKSHGTSPELLLAGILPCISALIGNTTVKLFDSFREKGNLFMLGLAPSRAGKTPTCNIGYARPLISHLEPRIDRSILVDETSSNGLFNHYVNFQKGADGESVPVLCIDEGYTFLSKLISTAKSTSHTSLTMERMCKLYDGDYWYSVKGSKGKRVGVQSARMSMATFTTPRRFLTDIWPKVVACRNGLADRVLIMYQDRQQMEIEEMEQCSSEIQQGPLKGLGTVYEHIYTEHHQENPVEYTLTASARELYIKYCKGKTNLSASVGAFNPECNAKTEKNALRLALNLHVLWHRLDKALNQLAGPTPTAVSESTMNMALTLHDTLLAFGGVAEAVSVISYLFCRL